MPRSASSASMSNGVGSFRYHPYDQTRSTNRQGIIEQPCPIRAPPQVVLGYRSPLNGESNNQSPSRRRRRTSEISVLDLNGIYESRVRNVPMHTDTVPYTETDDISGRIIARQDTPRPSSPPCPIFPNINQTSNGANYLATMVRPHSMDLFLPLPANWTAYDEISTEQRRRLDRGPVTPLNPADIASPRTQLQVQSLMEPRICIDSDNEIVDRFVTDCEKSSGRVYDRLLRRELHRISPFIDASSRRPFSGQVFDVLYGDIRRRCLFDDLRDANARSEGELEITKDECNLHFQAVPDYNFE